MDRLITSIAGAAGGLLRPAGSRHARHLTLLPAEQQEVEDEASFWAGNFSLGEKAQWLWAKTKISAQWLCTRLYYAAFKKSLTDAEEIQILARLFWPNTFRLDCTTLGKPIGHVTEEKSWEACLGRPLEQPVKGTCSIVACIVCLEAVHRLEYEKVHGEGTFPCTLMAEALQKLFDECCRDETWKPNEDCYVEDVLNKIQEMRPVLLVTAGVPARALPLESWQDHGLAGRSPEFVAALLNSHGPCIGVLCMCPWYHHFDAGRDDTLVYRGCGRCERDMDLAEELYGDQVVSHVIVCFAYRFCGDDDDLTNQQMHVLVRDNHWAADNGPQRWVDVEELTTLYTLSVESLID